MVRNTYTLVDEMFTDLTGNFVDRHMFLDGISDWSLRLCMSVKGLSRRKMGRFKSYGRADLMFFVHEDKACAVFAFRLGGGKSGKGRWITGRRKSFSTALNPSSTNVKVQSLRAMHRKSTVTWRPVSDYLHTPGMSFCFLKRCKLSPKQRLRNLARGQAAWRPSNWAFITKVVSRSLFDYHRRMS